MVPEATQFEAGVFALTAEGWAIVKRRKFDSQMPAAQWMQRSVTAMSKKAPAQRVRGSVVPMASEFTLEWVLGGYEKKRKEGDPEFNEPEARIFMVGDKTTASYSFRQGQYLAFIYYYTKLNGQAPSEVEMQRHFKVSPPSVHDMILMLEKKGLVARTPGAARSVRVLLPREQLPDLE